MQLLGDLEIEDFEDGGIDVHQGHRVVDCGGPILMRQFDPQGYPHNLLVERVPVGEATAIKELLPMVRRDDDHRIVVEISRAQRLQ